MQRTCPHCGSDTYFAREFPRVRDAAEFWRRKAERAAAEVTRLELEIEFGKHRDRTDVAWLQGKVVAQARELKRLNDAVNVSRLRQGAEVRPDAAVASVTPVEVLNAPVRR